MLYLSKCSTQKGKSRSSLTAQSNSHLSSPSLKAVELTSAASPFWWSHLICHSSWAYCLPRTQSLFFFFFYLWYWANPDLPRCACEVDFLKARHRTMLLFMLMIVLWNGDDLSNPSLQPLRRLCPVPGRLCIVTAPFSLKYLPHSQEGVSPLWFLLEPETDVSAATFLTVLYFLSKMSGLPIHSFSKQVMAGTM